MKLKSIELTNYRSINSVKISLKRIYGSNTYCLFGINESGKSSFLTGLAQYDEKDINYPIDYFDDTQPVKLIFEYQLDKDDNFGLRNKLEKDFDFPKEVLRKISVANVGIEISYTPNEESERSLKEEIQFKTSKFAGYKLEDDKLVKTDSDGEVFDMHEFMLNNLSNHFWTFSHRIVLWSAMDIYLIKDEIDLNEFMENPTGISIPLTNAFALSGISENEIEDTISKLKDPASIRNLESLLSEEVTNHILKIWRNHPIKVLFKINENKITLLVEDDGVKHKSKLTHQRSDGFRQFISFLLSISAESNNDELTNTMMLLDEPETHLHPQAQIDLMNELIKISSKNGNIVFYATHSNYMIDKKHLDRNIRVVKMNNESTQLDFISQKNSTYSEVNFTVFNIPTTDYHNELYGYLFDVKGKELESFDKDRIWINELTKKNEKVSLPKYIRNSIHHPENTSNKRFSERQLRKSIELLRKLKYK